MKTTVKAVFGILLLAASAGHAEDAGRFRDAPYPVALSAGETFQVCKSGQMNCPAIGPICDDLNVALPVDTPEGLGFKGVGRGTTLCSAGSPDGIRRVFRITVR